MERTSDNLLPELYKLWVQRKMENAGFGIPIEHLMIRKSQRSPSLRLRFGRSSPAVSVSLLGKVRQNYLILLVQLITNFIEIISNFSHSNFFLIEKTYF